MVDPEAKAVVGCTRDGLSMPGHSESVGTGTRPDAVAVAVPMAEVMLPSALEALDMIVPGLSSPGTGI